MKSLMAYCVLVVALVAAFIAGGIMLPECEPCSFITASQCEERLTDMEESCEARSESKLAKARYQCNTAVKQLEADIEQYIKVLKPGGQIIGGFRAPYEED